MDHNMITTITNFTDSYGITHSDPVFRIKFARCTKYISHSVQYENNEYVPTDKTNITIGYFIQYWPSQSDYNSGNLPVDFIDSNGEASFYFNSDDIPNDLVSAAENHFINEIL